MKKSINADQFLKAFQEVVERDGSDFEAQYSNHRSRTKIMLDTSGLLSKVCNELAATLPSGLEYKREWYTIDALFVSGSDLVYPGSPRDKDGSRLWYPSRLDVLIEHENGERLEEEMWKLLFWRAGLKVLVGYDYCEDEHQEPLDKRRPGKTKRDWAPDKLAQLREMHIKTNEGAAEDAEYLLLIGNRASSSSCGRVNWRWSRIDQDGCELESLSSKRAT